MKLITQPTVWLVGKSSIVDRSVEKFMEYHDLDWVLGTNGAHSDSETIPEIAGRVCYMSFSNPRPGGNRAYLEHILQVGHGSVIEHAVYNFVIVGISRSCSHEIVRHRAGCSYSQLSQRYVDESVAEYVIPHEVQNSTPEIFDRWVSSVQQSHNAYVDLITLLLEKVMGPCPQCGCTSARTEGAKYSCCNCQQLRLITTEQRKQIRQAARSVLPNATETKLFMSMNARAARSIIEQRCSIHAEPEIRKVFYQVWTWLRMESPNLFGDYIEESLPDGTTALRTTYTKV